MANQHQLFDATTSRKTVVFATTALHPSTPIPNIGPPVVTLTSGNLEPDLDIDAD
jgi:hypothetical protein